jgi:hypothetical protein
MEDPMDDDTRGHQGTDVLPRRAPARLMLPSIDEPAGVVDELQAWYLARAERDGWVYTAVLRQLINRMYRRASRVVDVLTTCVGQGSHCAAALGHR